MKKRLLSLSHCIVAIACLFVTQGCIPKDDSVTIKIGVALGDSNNSWNAAAGKYGGLRAASHRLPYFLGSSTNDSLQLALLRRMVAAECQAIVLASDDELDADSVSGLIISQGIPVILFEQGLDIDYTLLAKGDNAAAGRLAAGFVMDALNGQTPDILILKAPGIPYHSRIEAFRGAISGGNVKEVEVDAATMSMGVSAIQNLLSEEVPPSYNAIYAADDDLACGVIEALTEDSVVFRPAVIAGCGGSQTLLKLMAGITDESGEDSPQISIPEGITVGTVFYSPVFIQDAIEAAAQLVLKGEAPANREIQGPDPVLVTQTNAADYIDPESLY